MSNAEILWAPLVYSRTYELDFRLIAYPVDFKSSRLQWALDHIHATTNVAERLPNNPRWSLFRSDDHCVFGITCMLQEVMIASDDSQHPTQDSQNRPIYCFLGYVASLSYPTEVIPIPAYSGNLEVFRPLYSYIQSQWAQKHLDNSNIFSYRIRLLDAGSNNLNSKQQNNLQIIKSNIAQNKGESFPDLSAHRLKLWHLATKADFPVNLCLGLASHQDIINSPFFYGTVVDQQEVLTFQKPNDWEECEQVYSTVSDRSPENKKYSSEELGTKIQELGDLARKKALADLNVAIDVFESLTTNLPELANPFDHSHKNQKPQPQKKVFQDFIVEKPKPENPPVSDDVPESDQDWF